MYNNQMTYRELIEALEPKLKQYPLKLREHFILGLKTGYHVAESNYEDRLSKAELSIKMLQIFIRNNKSKK